MAAVLVLAALAAEGWWLFDYGRRQGGYDRAAAARREAELHASVARLKEENEALRERAAVLERSRQIDRRAQQEVKKSLDRLQDELLALREEVAFYRRIVGPRDGQLGVYIQSFRLEPADGGRRYRYKLVLSQAVKKHRVARGVVHLTLEGLQDGEARHLALREVSKGGKENIPFSFKYFQYIEGMLQIPDRFVPQTVRVEVVQRGKKQPRLVQSFAWSELTG